MEQQVADIWYKNLEIWIRVWTNRVLSDCLKELFCLNQLTLVEDTMFGQSRNMGTVIKTVTCSLFFLGYSKAASIPYQK